MFNCKCKKELLVHKDELSELRKSMNGYDYSTLNTFGNVCDKRFPGVKEEITKLKAIIAELVDTVHRDNNK